MGFMKSDLPDVDLETFRERPHLERMKILSRHWVEYGFGTPWSVHLLYVVKIALYVFVGLLFASCTRGLGAFSVSCPYRSVHPIALASPFLRSLDLSVHGLQWAWPTVDLAHPLDDGSAGVLVRSIEQTAQLLGRDGKRWRHPEGLRRGNRNQRARARTGRHRGR
jgi:hypothetical protein